MPASHATVPDYNAAAHTLPTRASRARSLFDGLGREWRRASWLVRLSVICLLTFYFLAAASPIVAPYDPIRQYRNLPDCPPMSFMWRAVGVGRTVFFVRPSRCACATRRHALRARPRAQDLRAVFSTFGHLFTTESADEPFFIMGSEGWGATSSRASCTVARVSMCVGLIGVLISFLPRHRGGRVFGLRRRARSTISSCAGRKSRCRCRRFISCSRWRR